MIQERQRQLQLHGHPSSSQRQHSPRNHQSKDLQQTTGIESPFLLHRRPDKSSHKSYSPWFVVLSLLHRHHMHQTSRAHRTSNLTPCYFPDRPLQLHEPSARHSASHLVRSPTMRSLPGSFPVHNPAEHRTCDLSLSHVPPYRRPENRQETTPLTPPLRLALAHTSTNSSPPSSTGTRQGWCPSPKFSRARPNAVLDGYSCTQ